MLKWLHDFFYSNDPEVKLAAGLSEPESAMMCELLENNGISAFGKNMQWISVAYGVSQPNAFDLWVKRSDVERARGILGSLLDGLETEESREVRRVRRTRRHRGRAP